MHYEFPEKYIAANCTKSPPIIDESTGEVLCGHCGLIFAEKTATFDEAQFRLDDRLNRTRTGSVTSLIMYDRGMYTTISNAARDASGRPISRNMKNRFLRLRLYDQRQKSGSAKSLRFALVSISTLRDKLSIPDPIAERASYICRKALENQVAKGRTISSISCASLYAACRESNTPRTLDEIARAANAPKRGISHTYKALLQVLNLQPTNHDLAEFVNKLGNQLSVSEKTKRRALGILSRIQDMEICVGRNPKSVVAALLYLACSLDGEKRNQMLISKIASVCPTTIQSTVRTLKKNLDLESS